MITHELVQGTPEWHAYRAAHDNASDAPAMMGVSSYKTRDELIAERATGIVPEVDAATQRLFDSGHRYEALARPLAEKIIGQDLYPCTGSLEGSRRSASFDGLTMLEDEGLEHKRLNQRLRAALSVPGCTGADLPLEYQVQMEQQCEVSGGERILFMASDWERVPEYPEDDVRGWRLVEEMHCWYYPNPALRAQIIAGWAQFHKDVAAWVPPEAKPVKIVAEPVEALPAVFGKVTGDLAIIDNLPEFESAFREFVEHRLVREPESDEDFAKLELQVKAMEAAEAQLDATEEAALSQAEVLSRFIRMKKALRDMVCEQRKASKRQLTEKKESIKQAQVQRGQKELAAHIDQLNAAMPVNYMPQVPADFAGAIKGKRTVDSLRSAVNDELARAKIAANEIANRIHANVKTLQASGLVVHDAAALVLKAPDDLAAIISNRVTAEQQRQEAERERIRKEEADRADREARETLAAEERAAQAAITQAAKAETLHPAVAQDLGGLVREQHAEAMAGLDAQQVIGTAQRLAAVAPAAPAARTGVPTLRIGVIKERLQHMTVTAEDLRAMGFEAAGRERAAPLYHEDDFPAICDAIAKQAMAAKAQFLRDLAVVEA